MTDSTERPRKPKGKVIEINPLLIDWIEDYKLDWQSTTEFVHQLLYEALLNYGQSQNDLTQEVKVVSLDSRWVVVRILEHALRLEYQS